MNRNILKLASILFVGLVLVTACNKDKEDKDSALVAAVKEAKGALKSVQGIDIKADTTPEDVFKEAQKLLKEVKSQAEKAKSETSEEKVKKELEKAIKAADDYTAATGNSAQDEKGAAEVVAREMLKALEAAEKA